MFRKNFPELCHIGVLCRLTSYLLYLLILLQSRRAYVPEPQTMSMV
jgi:hypothetical protein